MDYEIPKTEKEIKDLLASLKEHKRHNEDTLVKAEAKIKRYSQTAQASRRSSLREQLAASEEKTRKLQTELSTLENERKGADAKLKQYVESRDRIQNRLRNIQELNQKLQDALHSLKPPVLVSTPGPVSSKYADQFSEDERDYRF